MSEMAPEAHIPDCRWGGRDEPRRIPGRHVSGCADDECAGCQPCTERHCAVCRRAHADGTCPECVATTRDDLASIRLMCGALPEEVAHRGVNGEAMMLLGASADPEAWQHVQASYLAGRLPEGWFEASHGRDCPTLRNEPCVGCAGDELHPLTVVGTWEMVWRDFLEHETDERVTVEGAAGYLDRNLAYMADRGDVPFEDFARDLRRCRGHLEDVLRDGEQIEQGAPCPACDRPLIKVYGEKEIYDRWKCPNRRCGEWYLDHEYRRWVTADYRANSDRLTAPDIAAQYEIPAGTVRGWASQGKVRKRGKDSSGRQLYDVGDTLATREAGVA